MTKRNGYLLVAISLGLLVTVATVVTQQRQPAPVKPGGYIVQHDSEVQATEPGPHAGGGQTTAYSFFKNTPGLSLVFRKRALKPGAGIGYHLQTEDEIYYVLSGRGMMTIDDKSFEVGPGTSILTRTGSSHGLKQTGSEDLVMIINYEGKP